MIGRIGAVITRIETICNVLAGVAVLAMMTLITLDTLGRYLLNRPIPGVMEVVSCYLSVILVFLSISYCYRRGGHVKVDLVVSRLPEPAVRVLNIVLGFCSTAFFLGVAVFSARTGVEAFHTGAVPGGVVDTPIWPGYALLVVGVLLLAVRILLHTILLILGRTDPNITPEQSGH